MKKGILIAIASLFVLAFTACAPAVPDQRGPRTDDGSIRGIVTAVSDNSIEIAKMTGGNRQGNRGNPQDANRHQGPGNAQQPNGQQVQPSFDTSNMEKATYTIDANTQIVKLSFDQNAADNGQNGAPGAAKETQAGVSDIKQNTMVTIVLQTGSDKLAAKIVISDGFGFRGGRQ